MIQATNEWRTRRLVVNAKAIQDRAMALGVRLEVRDEHVAILVRELALIRVELEILGQAINGLAEWNRAERPGH